MCNKACDKCPSAFKPCHKCRYIRNAMNETVGQNDELTQEVLKLASQKQQLIIGNAKLTSRINNLKQKKIMGKYEKALVKSLKEMKVNNGKHFGGQAMTGAVEKKFHKESLNGTFKFLECYNDRPHMKRRHMEVFTIIAKCRTRFSKKFASLKFHKKTAEICQSYTKRFPIWFPEYSITRKIGV